MRTATSADVEDVVSAVSALLVELGGAAPAAEALRRTAGSVIGREDAGIVLVAESTGGSTIGILAASWVEAIHAGGTCGLIQDLWIDPAWRSKTVGKSLLEELRNAALARGCGRIEVGLPRARFAAIDVTTAFYRSNGYADLGPRMRLEIP